MVISAPEFDEDLSGHSAVELDEDPGVCHAAVSEYTGSGQQHVTECGSPVNSKTILPRAEFDDDDVEYCSECWPADIVDTS